MALPIIRLMSHQDQSCSIPSTPLEHVAEPLRTSWLRADWFRSGRLLAVGLLLSGAATGCATPTGGGGVPQLFGSTNATAKQDLPAVVDNLPPPPTKEQTATTLVRYGQLMEQKGQIPEARKYYQKAAETAPKMVEAQVGLARLDHSSGDIPKARTRLQEALKSSPNSGLALSAMAQLHAEQGEWKQSTEYCRMAMNAEPDNRNYKFQLAVALAKSGHVEQSIPFFARSVGEAAGHHNIGVILFDQGDLAGAKRHAERALQLDPNLADAEELLASIQGPHHGMETRNGHRNAPARPVVAAPVIRPGNSTAQSGVPQIAAPATRRPVQAVSLSSQPQSNGTSKQWQNQQWQNQQPVINGQTTDAHRAAPRVRIRPSTSTATGTDIASNWNDNTASAPQPPAMGLEGGWQPMPTASSIARNRGAQWTQDSSSSRN